LSEVPLAIVLLAVGALSSIGLARRPRAGLLVSMGGVCVGGLLCSSAAVRALLPTSVSSTTSVAWPLPLGAVTLTVDGLSAWFLLVIGVSIIAVAIYSWGFFQGAIGHEPIWAVGALLNVLVAAMVITVCAADLILFMIGWELMSLSAFLLIGFHHRSPETRHGAWMYLIATHLGTAFGVLPVFGAFAARAGSTSFASFAGAFDPSQVATCVLLFLLGLLGFGTKAGIIPMHVWLPAAHPVAPSPVSALMSGVVIKMGIYGLLRFLSWLPALPVSCAVVMLVIGMASGVMGVLYALAQHDIKRLLAYHSVENIGIIGLGIGMGMLGQSLGQPALVALGYGGALLHVLNHALFKGLLFLSAGAVIHATGTGDLERLGGLARKTPINAILFLIAAVSICGLPPFNGFVSEWLLYGSLFHGAMNASRLSAGTSAMGALALALMGGLALACFAKVFGVVFLGEPRDSLIRPRPTPSTMKLGMAIPAVLCIVIGLLPGLFVPLTAGGVSAVAGLKTEEFSRSIQGVLAPAGNVTLLAAVLLGVLASLAVARRALLRRTMPDGAPMTVTWGCGFTRPSPRMQYTASSFAWPLIQSFRNVLWPQRKAVTPAGPFPGRAELETHTPDMAEHDFYVPLFMGVSRVFRMIRTVSWSGVPALDSKPVEAGGRVGPLRALVAGVATALRQRRIHVYLAFIVLTLLVVFFIESLSSHNSFIPSVVPTEEVGTINGVSK